MTETIPASEYRNIKTPKRNKFGAAPIVIDGIRFDSKAEGRFYSTLKAREKAGEVYEVEMQPRYVFTHNGVLIGTYKADFRYYDATKKKTVVADVKGVLTEAAALRIKIVQALYGVEIVLVRKDDI